MIELFCTGRGGHRRRDLYMLWESEGQLRVAKRRFGAGATSTGPGPRINRPVFAGIRGTARGSRRHRNNNLTCPACGRNPSLSTDTLDKLLTAGLSEVDISLLPF